MEGRCGLYLKRLVIASILTVACRAFNIDVSKAVIFTGKNDTGFGTSAEFIQTQAGDTELYVGAPHSNVTDQTQSGVYFSCKPANHSTKCSEHWTTPQNWDYIPGQCKGRPPIDKGHITFGEEQELFGQTITVLNKTALLICGPMWSDLCYWVSDLIFNIGRCTVVNSWLPQAEAYTPYRDKDKYQKNVDLGNGSQRDYHYGRLEFGFSAASDGKGRAVIGAPGFSVARGSVAVFDTANMDISFTTDIYNPTPETYFGYAVAVGDFCGPSKFCFAVSDRSIFGVVRVMSQESKSFSVLTQINGTQRYASFGYSLGAVDVNGDGWCDLLVGAPMYMAFTNDFRSEDEGSVFVYISRGEVQNGKVSFKLPMSVSGDSKNFARFGSAISSIGDINRDSYLDIAVGAPQEDGAGAVYVYLGGPQGVVTPYTQKITGKDFTPPLSSFGYHISQHTTDLSDNNYPDFAVGCPKSDSVVFLRTKLIVNARVQIQVDPNPVSPDNQCPSDIDKNAVRARGCIAVKLCFTQNSDSKSEDSIDLDYTLHVDTLVSSDSLKRARIAQKSGMTITPTTTLSGTVSVSKNETCVPLTAILKEEAVNRNRFMPVQLHVTFVLNTTRFSDPIPVLNKSLINTAVEEVTFKNQCGEDEKCHSDLVLTGRVLHVPNLVNYQTFNVVNRTRGVELHLQLVNRNETAYGIRLTANITGHIAFDLVYSKATSHFTCNGTAVDGAEVTGSEVVCSNWAPMANNETVDITLQFKADSVPLHPHHSDVVFQVEAMPYSPKENPEADVNDNCVRLASPLRIVADLAIDGSPEPRSQHVRKSDTTDLVVKHTLYLRNGGPSFLPATHINVSIPQRSSSGPDLFNSREAHNVTIKYKDGKLVSCDLISIAGKATGGTNTPAPTTSTQATTTDEGIKAARTTTPSNISSTTPFNPFSVVKPSRRKRQQVEEEQQNDDHDNTMDASNERLLRMDCRNYECAVYRCPLPPVQPPAAQSTRDIQINITLALERSALPFSDSVDTLMLVTLTQVAQPDHLLFFPWSTPRELEVQTIIYEVKTGGEEVSIWIIIGGVLGGLLLLLIIGVIAWKLGFFRRRDQAKLLELKRKSGFYDNSSRRSTKSTRSRTSNLTRENPE